MPQQHQDSDARQQRHQPLAVLVVAEQADKAVLQPQPADRRGLVERERAKQPPEAARTDVQRDHGLVQPQGTPEGVLAHPNDDAEHHHRSCKPVQIAPRKHAPE